MKKKNLKSLKLNKNTVSNFENENVNGGVGSGVACVTQVGSCQTTSCVCTDNFRCLTNASCPPASGMTCPIQVNVK